MSTSITDLFQQACQLDDQDRATLAGLLLESLETEMDEDVEAAWREELKRRADDVKSGRVELVAWEDVKAKLMGRSGGESED